MASCAGCGTKIGFLASHCDECLKKEEQRQIAAYEAKRADVARFEAARVPPHMTSTTFELSGYRVVRTLGVCRGISVRSRSIGGNFIAGLESAFGGEITALAKLCEDARSEAFARMLHSATEMGAHAVVGLRFDANEVYQGVTEMLAYGTAVHVELVPSEPTVS